MPESQEQFRQRMDMQRQEEALVDRIENSGDDPKEKTVELLAFIARQLIEQNFKLDTIQNELFDHTLALDGLSNS